MKSIRLIIMLVFALFTFVSAVFAFSPGAVVEVEWKGAWYPATILKVDNGKYFIHYEGYDDSWNEWVENSRIKGGETDQPAAAKRSGSTNPDKSSKNPAPKSTSSEMVVRKGGSIWASIEAGGVIRINGSIVGEFSEDGTVRKSGSIVGEVDTSGTIRKNGSIVGTIESGGTFRKTGSIIGSIEGNGTIRKGGSIWGESSNCCSSHAGKRKISALLVFFVNDFGF